MILKFWPPSGWANFQVQYDKCSRTSLVLKFSEYISYIKIKKSGPSSGSLHDKKCILLSVMVIWLIWEISFSRNCTSSLNGWACCHWLQIVVIVVIIVIILSTSQVQAPLPVCLEHLNHKFKVFMTASTDQESHHEQVQ